MDDESERSDGSSREKSPQLPDPVIIVLGIAAVLVGMEALWRSDPSSWTFYARLLLLSVLVAALIGALVEWLKKRKRRS
jgi:membrane protein implicated in regulation of membrane protease activity